MFSHWSSGNYGFPNCCQIQILTLVRLVSVTLFVGAIWYSISTKATTPVEFQTSAIWSITILMAVCSANLCGVLLEQFWWFLPFIIVSFVYLGWDVMLAYHDPLIGIPRFLLNIWALHVYIRCSCYLVSRKKDDCVHAFPEYRLIDSEPLPITVHSRSNRKNQEQLPEQPSKIIMNDNVERAENWNKL